ncbi:putative RNA polymerase III subunit C17 [Trachipleistophora hominis]|uniref:Putative RNA polymerase III subunit C17 n=1 Tax=Trachipleistophora hominis TaxID=72359 RepID=L7JTA2_TRAHO|nr:putative RNA polymerase III subunit C17 [Trachipleistophora hominis]
MYQKKCIPKSQILHFMNNETMLTEEEKTMAFAVKELCKNCMPTDVIYKTRLKLKKMNLYPLEICQLLDMWPKNLLDLQMVIEDMEERFSVHELEGILDIFRQNEIQYS